jgi:hypothetical protein
MTRTIVDDGSIATALAAQTIAPDGVVGHLTKNPDDRPAYPFDDQFGDDDYYPAAELEALVARLIAFHERELGFLDALDVRITVLWKRHASRSHGKVRAGSCQKLSGLAKYFGRAEYVIAVAADVASVMRWTNLQMEALLFHELCHIKPVMDENTNSPTYGDYIGTALTGHDAEVFNAELVHYGAWNPQNASLAATIQTMKLPLAAGNGASDV